MSEAHAVCFSLMRNLVDQTASSLFQERIFERAVVANGYGQARTADLGDSTENRRRNNIYATL